MEERTEKIRRFIGVCDELVAGSYMEAEKKISEALKAVADSRDLRELFTAVTEKFDYPAAKSACLRGSFAEGERGMAYLPSERTQLLAFVFCLLVEIDAGTIRLNEFLQRYFYRDGSYTASYTLFSDRVIRPFRDIVRNCFPDCGKSGEAAIRRRKREELFGEIAEHAAEERARIAGLALAEEDGAAGDAVLAATIAASGRRDAMEVAALLAGYRYFLRAVNGEDASADALFSLAGEL